MENESAKIKGYTKDSDFFVFDVPKEKMRLKYWELQILDARISKNAIIQLQTEELQDRFAELLPQIAAITGMALPEGKFGIVTQTEIITFLLDFGYKLLNEDEILLAFRLNAQGEARFGDGSFMEPIEPIGKYLNAFYCGRVLSRYMILRNNFDSQLRNIMSGY